MSFCFLYNVVSENYSVQNSPLGGGGGGGEGGLLPAQGLKRQQFIHTTISFSDQL